MLTKPKLVAAILAAGLAALGVAPAAQAHTPPSAYVQRIGYHADRAADRTHADVGDTINQIGLLINRTVNPR